MSKQFKADLRVNRQRVKFILLFGLRGSVHKGPCDFGHRPSGDGDRDFDGGPCSAVKQVVSAHIQGHRGFNW